MNRKDKKIMMVLAASLIAAIAIIVAILGLGSPLRPMTAAALIGLWGLIFLTLLEVLRV